jgi:hypothetical protein
MKFRTIWTEPLGMLLASGSPGSALAYQLGVANFEPGMVRRTMTTDDCAGGRPEAAEEPGVEDAFFHRARALR